MLNSIRPAAIAFGAAIALAGCESFAEDVAEIVETTYFAELSGGAEVPGPGDPDGTGRAEITVADAVDRLCWDLTVANISPPTAAHIHRGGVGVSGPPVVTLEAPVGGSAEGCTQVPDAIQREIQANPAGFYVNVHTADYPGGAVRGQLRR